MLALLAESESIADDALQAPRPICRTGDDFDDEIPPGEAGVRFSP